MTTGKMMNKQELTVNEKLLMLAETITRVTNLWAERFDELEQRVVILERRVLAFEMFAERLIEGEIRLTNDD